MICLYIFQVPLDLNDFRTNHADALPLLHFILSIDRRANSLISEVISNGLDCTLKSSSGQKAGEMFPKEATDLLYNACITGHVTVVRGMLDAGTDVNQCSKFEESPLMWASRNGHIDVINVLVSHGANVNYVSGRKKNTDVINVLVSYGVDVNCLDWWVNKTSLLLACEEKQWDAAVVLYQHIMKAEPDMTAKQHNDEAFEVALQHHGVRYLQYVAENDRCAYDTLVSKLSLPDACKHGYDIVVRRHALHHNLSQTHIIDNNNNNKLSFKAQFQTAQCAMQLWNNTGAKILHAYMKLYNIQIYMKAKYNRRKYL